MQYLNDIERSVVIAALAANMCEVGGVADLGEEDGTLILDQGIGDETVLDLQDYKAKFSDTLEDATGLFMLMGMERAADNYNQACDALENEGSDEEPECVEDPEQLVIALYNEVKGFKTWEEMIAHYGAEAYPELLRIKEAFSEL